MGEDMQQWAKSETEPAITADPLKPPHVRRPSNFVCCKLQGTPTEPGNQDALFLIQYVHIPCKVIGCL